MSDASERAINRDELYRAIIDRLVGECHEGQGQIAARRVRGGVWNSAASADTLADQHRINQVLTSLDDESREVVATIAAG